MILSNPFEFSLQIFHLYFTIINLFTKCSVLNFKNFSLLFMHSIKVCLSIAFYYLLCLLNMFVSFIISIIDSLKKSLNFYGKLLNLQFIVSLNLHHLSTGIFIFLLPKLCLIPFLSILFLQFLNL